MIKTRGIYLGKNVLLSIFYKIKNVWSIELCITKMQFNPFNANKYQRKKIIIPRAFAFIYIGYLQLPLLSGYV